ncbi:MAG: leucine-rich repeat domain-containing protein [Firmicutes bacterium]|nr:leucine-rich repeat domain-containing protein [Bacillota bacterium]
MDYLQLLLGDGGIIGVISLILTFLIAKGKITSEPKDKKEGAKEHKLSSFLSRHKGKLLVIWAVCVIFAVFNVVVNFMSSLKKVSVSQIEYSYSVKDDKTVCITGLLDESIINLEIPEEIFGKDVTEISDRAFENCTSITSVTIPASVKLIGSNAFLNCTSLTQINVAADNENYSSAEGILFNKTKTNLVCYPDGKNIGEVVKSGTCGDSLTWDLYESGVLIISGTGKMMDFEDISTNPWHDNCSDITSVVFDGSITAIGWRAFQGCNNLTSIVLPDSITQIGDAAFSKCSSLTSITIPDLVTVIHGATFFGCSSLTDVILPDSLTTLAGSSFHYCSSLSNIVIPESVTWIGPYTFSYCINLKSITIPDSVSHIGHDAFSWCTSLADVKIPKSVDVMEYGVFFKCTSLKSIVIPDGISSIDHSTFNGCSSLTSITITKSVTSINEYAFDNLTSLTDVYYTGSEEEWKKISISKGNDYLTNATIHYNSQVTAE